MSTVLFSREPIYEPRELTNAEQLKFREIYENVKKITDNRNYDFSNPSDMYHYTNSVIKLVEENSDFRVIKLEFDNFYSLHLTLEIKPQLSIIIQKGEEEV